MNIDSPEVLKNYRDQLRDAIAGDLAGSGRASRLKPRALAVGIPAAAAAATAAVVLLSAGGTAGPTAADAALLRHVSAELTGPPGSILHEAATVTLTHGSSTPFELWEQTGGTGVYRVIKGGQEVSQSAAQNEIYDSSNHTVTVSPLPPQVHAQEAARGGDLAGELKQMVDSGHATATRTTFDGAPAYELRLPAGSEQNLNGTAYVAQSDYRPLELDSSWGRVVFSTYEYLPATAANDALLAVTTAHPDATVVTETGNG